MPVADVITAVKDHANRAPMFDMYRDYEEGRQFAKYATFRERRLYETVVRESSLNMCELVRSNYSDLVQIQAWAGDDAETAMAVAEMVDLDMVLGLTVNEAFRCGDAFIHVWPGKDGTLRPWFHRADQVVFQRDPSDPTRFAWVAKLWQDGETARVNVYYEDRVERWAADSGAFGGGMFSDSESGWWPYNGDDSDAVIAYESLGITGVPWVHVPFDAQSQGGRGRSVLRDVIGPQDTLNEAVLTIRLNMKKYGTSMVALLNYVAQQSIDPATGEVQTKSLNIDETRDAIFGIDAAGPLVKLDPPDSSKILAVKRDAMVDIATVAGIPISEITPDLGNIPSGVSLRVLATRRTNKVRAFTKSLTGALTQVMALLGVEDAHPEWIDPAPMDDTERVSNAQARRDLGYPLAEVLPDLGESPDDIDRIMAGLAAEGAGMAAVGRALLEDPGVMSRGDS